MGEIVKENLHLFWDEKITAGIIENFEAALPGRNDYIFWWNHNADIHFAKENEKCFIIRNEGEVPNLDYTQYSKVILHALDTKKVKFCIENVPETTPIYWVLWGADLYNNLLEIRGYRLYHKFAPQKSFTASIKDFIKRLGFLSAATKKYLSFFEKRNVTMVCAEAEYKLLRMYYPRQTKRLKNNPNFFYYPAKKILGSLANAEANGNRILVGNSNSYTNNHFYAFKFLKKANLSGKNLLLPLNYSGTKETRDAIIKEGERLFGNQFHALTEFLPLDDYNKLMTEAEYAVYANWRQEAMGNIVIALYLGTKVFLSKRNPLLKHFRSMGAKVFVLEDVKEDSFQVPLTKEERVHNRNVIEENYSWERMEENIKTLFG